MNQKYKDDYQYGFSDGVIDVSHLPRGHSEAVIREISALKGEPEWMTNFRLEAYKKFLELPLPTWGPDLSHINFDDLTYYVKPTNVVVSSWEEIPEKIRNTFERIGISKSEQEWLGGMATQYDSEMIYALAREELDKLGVIFTSTDEALKNHEELFKKYFGTLVKNIDNKFAALNTAFWSGGTFVYIPPNVNVERPLQSYFRINARGAGQFERSLIIVDKGAKVHYVEGCSAPIYSTDNLHAAVVEVFVEENASCKYTTIQNWSDNVLNLVTKRALVKTRGMMEWIDGNIGSKLNMKYPSTILEGDYAKGSCLSIAVALGKGLIQDAGAKMIHLGKHTSSTIWSKSIAGFGGITNYRGKVWIDPLAKHAKSKVECDTMILDEHSRSDTIPSNIVANASSSIEHEAVVSRISEKELYYLQTKGLNQDEGKKLIVMGFIEPFAKELPMEYAVELNRLIALEIISNIG